MAAFGDALCSGPLVKICCGPRCGAERGHRLLYDAIEKRALETFADAAVLPTMCQGLCGGGVTVVVRTHSDAPVVKQKIRDLVHARNFMYHSPKDS